MSDFDPVTLVEPAATKVRDPLSGRSVWLAGIVKNPVMADGALGYSLVFQPGHDEATRSALEVAVENQIRSMGYHGALRPTRLSAPPATNKPPAESVPGMNIGGVTPHGGPIRKKRLPGVGHIVAVASGKGGVGKSTVSSNLAIALQRAGYSVGLLDLDVYGPSLPTMMNVTVRPMVDDGGKIVPVNAYGVRCLSMGMLVDEEQAMIWRGPMIMGVLRQFLQDVRWDGVDYLIIDLPPGTGDAQLSLIQSVELSGAVIVTTPQKVALADAVRGISMFNKLEVPIVGLVENMAYYLLPDGSRDYVFGEGGGVSTAARFGTPLLGQLPLQTSIRKACDQGLPTALGTDESAQRFGEIARQVAEALPLAGV
jgi:ATP-binding protein involved in chromosome partitioning